MPVYRASQNATRSISAHNYAECGAKSHDPTIPPLDCKDWEAMKDPPAESRVTAFLKGALADAAVGVPKLEVMAREVGLLGERQHITNAKQFRQAKGALGIQSVRNGFGPGGGWLWK